VSAAASDEASTAFINAVMAVDAHAVVASVAAAIAALSPARARAELPLDLGCTFMYDVYYMCDNRKMSHVSEL
jgi:hypothetical protein